MVGAALGDGGHLAGLSKLGVIEHAIDAQLRDRFARRKGVRQRAVAGGVLRGNAVNRDFGLEWKAALHRALNVCAVVGAGIGLYAGQRLNEVERAGSALAGAVVGGQVLDVDGVEGRGDGLRVGFNSAGRLRVHRDLLVHAADLEGSVLTELLACGEHETLKELRLEARGTDFKAVAALAEIENLVVAYVVGRGGPGYAGVDIGDLDGCSGDDGPGGIFDIAEDGALCGLRVRGKVEE